MAVKIAQSPTITVLLVVRQPDRDSASSPAATLLTLSELLDKGFVLAVLALLLPLNIAADPVDDRHYTGHKP
jgi:hypothetical protein